MNINKTPFVAGLLIVLTDVVFLLMDFIESGVAGLIGVVGISLIAASSRQLRR